MRAWLHLRRSRKASATDKGYSQTAPYGVRTAGATASGHSPRRDFRDSRNAPGRDHRVEVAMLRICWKSSS